MKLYWEEAARLKWSIVSRYRLTNFSFQMVKELSCVAKVSLSAAKHQLQPDDLATHSVFC
jgi:hypothetical protein